MTTEVRAHPDTAAWRTLARNIGIGLGTVTLIVALSLRDVDAAMLTAGLAASIALLRFRRGGLGLIGLAIAFLLTAFWCLVGAIVNFAHSSTFVADALTSVLGVLAVTGLVSVALAALHRPDGAARTMQMVAAATVVVALVASFVASRSAKSTAKPGDIKLVAKHVRYTPRTIHAEAGRIGIDVANKDFFWHTLTLSKLHVSLNVPTRGEGRIEFDAKPGTYEFMCLIPGHAQAGMKGTLVVR